MDIIEDLTEKKETTVFDTTVSILFNISEPYNEFFKKCIETMIYLFLEPISSANACGKKKKS